MNEELFAELENEREGTPDEVETTVDTDTGSDDDSGDTGDTGGSDKSEGDEKFKPWELAKKEDPAEDDVPEEFKQMELQDKWRVNRLNKEINAKKEAQERAAAIERELHELRAKIQAPTPQEQEKPQTADDLVDISKYPNTEEGAKQYIADLRAKERELAGQEAVAQIERNFAQREYQRAVQAQNEQMAQAFDGRIKAAAERNPEVTEAVSFLDQYADHLDVNVLREIMLDEHAGELIHEMVTNKAKLTQLFKGDPAATIRMMAKESAKIELHKEQEAGKGGATFRVPASTPPEEQAKSLTKMVPKTAKGGASSSSKDIDKMSVNELEKYLKGKR